MVFGCNWLNCSKQFDDQKQYKEHLMREHVGENQKEEDENGSGTSQQIFLPVETWVEILLCISRIELAQTVSLTNWLFSAISRPRIDKENKRIVPPLRFSNDGNGMAKLQIYSGSFEQIPIAQVPPPINILGFEGLYLYYIDDHILEFMRLIKPILGTNIYIFFWNCNGNGMLNCVQQLCNIIKGNASSLAIVINNFNLLDMEFLKTIQFVQIKYRIGVAIDEMAMMSIEHILKWMHSPLDGNQSRYITMPLHINNMNEMMKICKWRFLESTVPVSFILHFESVFDEPILFSIENRRTGEQLTLDWFIDNEGPWSYLMLCRSKIGNDQGWRELIRKMNNRDENKTRLRINL